MIKRLATGIGLLMTVLWTLMWFPSPAAAERPVTIKLATLAPKGSFYHRALQEMGEKWRQVQGDRARFIIYTDGTQGGEADVVRRMRIGHLNAALLSVVGLSEIDDTTTALQMMPLVFRDWEELDHVRDALRPTLEKYLHKKGFIALFWVEGGWVRFFSKKPAMVPDDFKGRKIFAWAGDPEQVEIMKSLGYRPVVLESTDILPSLQSGMINVVAVPAVYALASQMDATAPYMADVNWAPIVGAAVIKREVWEAMTPHARRTLVQEAERVGREIRARRESTDRGAIDAMIGRGLKVHSPTPAQWEEWHRFAQAIHPKIRGPVVPAKVFDRVQNLLSEYRRSRK